VAEAVRWDDPVAHEAAELVAQVDQGGRADPGAKQAVLEAVADADTMGIADTQTIGAIITVGTVMHGEIEEIGVGTHGIGVTILG